MITQLFLLVKWFKPTNFMPVRLFFFDISFIILYTGKNPLFFTGECDKIYVEILCPILPFFVGSGLRKRPGKELFYVRCRLCMGKSFELSGR